MQLALAAEADMDSDLIQRALAGEEAGYAGLMRRHNQRLYRVAWALMHDFTEAEDVVQESWVRAFQHLKQVADPAHFRGWITRIVVNEGLQRRRQAQRRDLSNFEAETMTHENPEVLSARRELRPILEAAVGSLPDLLRVVFVLREVEGMSVAEVASALGLQEATVKTRAFRARELLRQRLAAWSEEALPELLSFAGERCSSIAKRVLTELKRAGELREPHQ